MGSLKIEWRTDISELATHTGPVLVATVFTNRSSGTRSVEVVLAEVGEEDDELYTYGSCDSLGYSVEDVTAWCPVETGEDCLLAQAKLAQRGEGEA